MAKPNPVTDASTLPVYSCSGRKWKFNTDWYSAFPWLHWKDGKLLCHLCSNAAETPGFVTTKRNENAFTRTGTSRIWKNATKVFCEHSKSQAHQEIAEKMALMKGRESVACQLDKQLSLEQEEARTALRAIAKTLITVGQTGSMIRGHDDDSGNFAACISRRSEDIPQLAKSCSGNNPL